MSMCRSRRKERDIREESSVSDRLDIRGDEVVILVSEVDITRFEAFEYALDERDTFIWGTVLDNDLEDDGINGSGINERSDRRGNGNQARTNGCPAGGTVGPWRECSETM
jgi:hypothetical protein